MRNDPGESRSDAPKQRVCSSCGFANPSPFRFCGGCGASLQPGVGAPAPEAVVVERPQAERRQVTVLFCDLVDSSMLANRLDPEELRDVILSYQQACTSVIRRFDGTVSRYVGDGILALFGYPRAHEDDAERAVLSGLDIIRAIGALPRGSGTGGSEPLAARVGIATGLVVVGDLIGEGAAEEEAVMGETPNLAARLQGFASPNCVVIASSTRALIGERFSYADLGTHDLKGFADPVPLCQVLAARPSASRFEAAQPRRMLPLVDRDEPLSWLLQLWRQVGHDGGRVALLRGEAGIGKSRVVEALRENIAASPHAQLHYQCSPHYINSALRPVIEHIERAAGIRPEDDPSAKIAKLSMWPGAAGQAPDAVSLLAPLLSIPANERSPSPAMSPQRQKELTFELLVGYMQQAASTRPLLIVFEDMHWVDPTTQEFLTLLIERVRDMRAFVVLTFRPDYSPPWSDRTFIQQRELQRLAPGDVMGLAQHVAGGRRLPRAVVEQVVAKTDGVPLFVEELTKAVIGTGLLDEHHDHFTLDASLSAFAIPSTLQDSLMARLDQLGPAKIIAQVAGAIGREFTYELLEPIVPLPPERLREGLALLEQAGLVYADPRTAEVAYVFKHALVQEVAYQSLLRSRRRTLHRLIAEALETRFPQTARNAPELIAHHWQEAGNVERAVEGWLAAGRRASERSEYREAIEHLRKGLELVPRLADPHAQRDRELALRLALAPAIIISQGGGTPEVGALYARALELCNETPASTTHFVAHWGWWRASMDHRMGRERADKVLALAHDLGEPALLLQAHHCQWATLYMLGEHGECCRHIEAGLGLYDASRDRVDAALYSGHDARVCALGEGGLAHWILGYPQRAHELVKSALAWAEELSHVGTQAHAMDYALVLRKFRRDPDAVYRQAGELVAYASEQKLRVHRARGAFFRGWARAMLQDVAGGLSEMLDGIASEQASDTPHDFTLYYEMLAEVYGRAGRLEEALRTVGEAFAVAERHGIVFWNAELHRQRGELLLASGNRGAAEASFQEALACARGQGARSLELRAAVSLARVRLKEGGSAAAAVILRPVYEGFSEGFDTPDLIEARKILEALD